VLYALSNVPRRDKFGARTAQGTGTMLYAEITKLTILRGFVFVECRNAKRNITLPSDVFPAEQVQQIRARMTKTR
jgi:hypothetical protein